MGFEKEAEYQITAELLKLDVMQLNMRLVISLWNISLLCLYCSRQMYLGEDQLPAIHEAVQQQRFPRGLE